MTHSSNKTALVIGATGSFGAHAAQAMIKHGWIIRALARDPVAAAAKAGPRTPIEWVKGDAMDAASVRAAAEGVSVIVHAANPPGYRNWKGTVLPMMESTIAAAKAVGARVVLPGNVYNYAPDAGGHIAEGAPQAPVTRKGKIRVEMERRLATSGVKSLILRSGDFFGPAAPNSAFGWLTTRSKDRVTGVYAPGAAAHAFAYMPDLAETLARLLDAEDRLADVDSFHFRGHLLADGELGASMRRVTRQPQLKIAAFPWIVVWAAAPFVETFRELLEMRYLWNREIGLSQARLEAFLGDVPATPLDTAVRATVHDLGCLVEDAPYAATACASASMAPTM
ncbi:MAG TPA: NmrA family NAD(P)-binding protein [Caulobacteraceae bacterium]|jgi:nucleoside-diphosphate-sugar epimerase